MATSPQHMDALAHANTVRIYRAKVKKEIASQPTSTESLRLCASYLADDPPEIQLRRMGVAELVKACRSMGDASVAEMLLFARVGPKTTLEGLTERQRAVLLAQLEAKATRTMYWAMCRQPVAA